MAPLLYHYTNAAGLIGITRSRTLWASDARFLNDSLEMKYAREQMTEAVRRESASSKEPTRARILRIVYDLMQDTSASWPSLFVACFCDNGDLLGQWRAYGREQGFAIGFDSDMLRLTEVEEDARNLMREKIPGLSPNLVQVLYGDDALSAIPQALETMGYVQSGGGHYGVVAVNEVAWYVLPELCRLKHPSFHEEREWRLVYVIWLDRQRDIAKFRPSAVGVVPYIEVSLAPGAIREVVLGPGNHLDTRLEGVRTLLDVWGLQDVQVRTSEVPLRAL